MVRKRAKNSSRLTLTKQQVAKVVQMEHEWSVSEGTMGIEVGLQPDGTDINDGGARTRNDLKNGRRIPKTQGQINNRAMPVNDSSTEKDHAENAIPTRTLRVRCDRSPVKPMQMADFRLRLSKIVVNPETDVPAMSNFEEMSNEGIAKSPLSLEPANFVLQPPENNNDGGSFKPSLSSTVVEECLKSPTRSKYLLKQLENSLSPKYTELKTTSAGVTVSRYGRIQKQKENSDYIPLDLAKFITKSPAKAKTIKKEPEHVLPLVAPPSPDPIVVEVKSEPITLPSEVFPPDPDNGNIQSEITPIVPPEVLGEVVTTPTDTDVEACTEGEFEEIPVANPNASLLGFDEIQIVDLDASYDENATAAIPAETNVKLEVPNSPEKSFETDSAEGSSLTGELEAGQLLWGALNAKSVHWPCLVSADPENGLLQKNKGNKLYMVHVNFFADNGRRAWIQTAFTLPFTSLEEYHGLVKRQFKVLRAKLSQFKHQRPMWLEAIRQAEEMQQHPLEERIQRFQELLEADQARPRKQFRNRAKSLSTGYHSNSFDETSDVGRKRLRSPTPESPAYEALPIPPNAAVHPHKRIKLEPDDRDLFRSTISRYFQSMPEGSDFLETASLTSSESDDISEMMEFDKEIYNNFLNLSRLYVFEGQAETEVDRKLQKYVQKICALRMHSIANGGRISNRLRSQALRKLGRELGIDKVKVEDNPETPDKDEASTSFKTSGRSRKREKKSLEELFVFNLEKNYLMRGAARGSVCVVCLKPNDLVKCSKCHNQYHSGCSNDPSVEVAVTDSKAFICLDCSKQKPLACFVCHDQEESLKENPKYRCSIGGCGKHYHSPCLRLFPQHKFTGTSKSSTLFCPYHTCHTCVSDDPRTNATSTKGQLVRCIKCPSSYHSEAKCIPAGSQILSWAAMICPKHNLEQSSLNVNWCFLCCKGGSLICCETCPTAFHLDCLKFTPPEGKYICEECESGRMPLYNEIVWAKYSHFRFWPAMTIPPPMVPDKLELLPHEKWDICVRFFGSHDHVWVNRRRIYLYQEGDSDITEKKRGNMAKRYHLALQEAKTVHGLLQERNAAKKLKEVGEGSFKPPMYVKIKSNRYIAPLKPPTQAKEDEENNACECKPTDDDPCGPESNCINRALLVECNPKSCPAGERCQNQCFEKKQYPALVAKRIPQKGWGLVTMEDIRQGQFVIEYVGEVINNEELARRLQHKVEQKDENYYFLTVDSELTIDAGPKGNLARFMNHSCEPNCETMLWKVGSVQAVGLFAIKNITAGEELTFNYNFESKGDKKKVCFCNASKCSGYIGMKYRPPVGLAGPSLNESKKQKGGKNRNASKQRRKSTALSNLIGKRRKSTFEKPKPELGSSKGKKSRSLSVVEELPEQNITDLVNVDTSKVDATIAQRLTDSGELSPGK